MRALVYRGPGRLRVEERDVAPLGPGEARVRVEAAGLCGTDVRIFSGQHRAYADVTDRVPGHEIVGRLVELGPGAAATPALGTRVFLAPNFGCGVCDFCRRGAENLCRTTRALGITRDGGFAEEVVVPAAAVRQGNLIALPDDQDPDAATLIEPLACVVRGQDKVALGAGDTVYVAGAGPVGLLHVALARARGASMIICADRSSVRRAAAGRAGARTTLDWSATDPVVAVADLTEGRGVDVVVAAAPSHELQAQSVRLAAPSGRVLLFAGLPRSRPTVELDTNEIHYKELLLTATTASSLTDCTEAARLLSTDLGDVGWLVTDTFGLDDAEAAAARAQDRDALKVVVTP
ncbi:MAG: alcohol dehydrogenase catalytic domain-containing protein [Janthinobacterium lividum]